MSAFDSWEPQLPPPGFADKVTAAVLHERALPKRSPRRTWVVLLAAACLAVGGAAWAWTTQHHAAMDAHGDHVGPVDRADPTPSAVMRAFPPAETPAAPKVVARPKPAAMPSASAAAPRPTVPAPTCICNDYGCDCGPEQAPPLP